MNIELHPIAIGFFVFLVVGWTYIFFSTRETHDDDEDDPTSVFRRRGDDGW
jgi:hypothetical protein